MVIYKSNPISQVAVEWLTYVEQTENITIDHIGKHGRERQVGGKRLRIDGKCGYVLFEIDGCYFHGHCCRLTEHVKDKSKFEEIRKKTEEKHAYLRGLGYDLRASVKYTYECSGTLAKKQIQIKQS